MGLCRFASGCIVVVTVFSVGAGAQNKIKESSVQVEPASRPKTSKKTIPNKQVKLTAQQQHALRLLATARAEAAGLEPEMRAFVLWKVARGLESVDPEKSMNILKDAFRASQSVEENQNRRRPCYPKLKQRSERRSPQPSLTSTPGRKIWLAPKISCLERAMQSAIPTMQLANY